MEGIKNEERKLFKNIYDIVCLKYYMFINVKYNNNKTINIVGLVFTAGDTFFQLHIFLNDVFTEVYGYNKSRFVIWISFFCNLLMIMVFQITIALPSSEAFEFQSDLENILGNTPEFISIFISF